MKHPHTDVIKGSPNDITDAFADYYEELYSLQEDHSSAQPTQSIIDNFLSRIQLPTISPEQLEMLFHPITTQEISQVIASLPNLKSPGCDGFSNEYYKIFKDNLAPPLAQVFNQAATKGTFPTELLKVIITTHAQTW